MEPIRGRLLLRPSEAAVAIGVSRAKIYDLMARKLIPSIRLGSPSGAIRVPAEALMRWIDHQVAAQNEGTDLLTQHREMRDSVR